MEKSGRDADNVDVLLGLDGTFDGLQIRGFSYIAVLEYTSVMELHILVIKIGSILLSVTLLSNSRAT